MNYMGELNKAAIILKPGELTVREVPTPDPGPYGALCKMLYGATCTGTDSHLLAGTIPWPVSYPTVLGHESVGRVVSVGAKVKNLKIGDVVSRVGMREEDCLAAGYNHNWGGFCAYGVAMDYAAMRDGGLGEGEYGAYRVHHVVPPQIDPRAATMIITWRETQSYLNRIGVGRGSTVLVLGSGGVGLSFLMLAKAAGAKRIVSVGSEKNLSAAKRAGADAVFDYKSPDWASNARKECEFDFIIDSVASADGLDTALGALRAGGTCGVYGITSDGGRRVKISPAVTRGFAYFPCCYDEEETNGQVIDLLLKGKLDASVFMDLDKTYALDDIASAYEKLGRREHIKALVAL